MKLRRIVRAIIFGQVYFINEKILNINILPASGVLITLPINVAGKERCRIRYKRVCIAALYYLG